MEKKKKKKKRRMRMRRRKRRRRRRRRWRMKRRKEKEEEEENGTMLSRFGIPRRDSNTARGLVPLTTAARHPGGTGRSGEGSGGARRWQLSRQMGQKDPVGVSVPGSSDMAGADEAVTLTCVENHFSCHNSA